MPTSIPKVTPNDIVSLKTLSYSEVAFEILRKFIKYEIPEGDLERICGEIYDYPVPLEPLGKDTFIAYLDRGPSASFKDFAAGFMARVMAALKDDNHMTNILVATSGDTGSAIGEAFRGVDGFRVFILYPEQEVSEIQRLQLDRIGDNVNTISVTGQFDDCQKIVKKAFLDPDLSPLNLTSCNSINIGRILPQIVYYFYTVSKISDDKEPLIFSVPSGNFGNSLGCEFARRMGMPLSRIVIAVYENDEFPQFLSSGDFTPISPSRQCLSNAMNVGNPSNLARYFDLYNGHLLSNGIVKKKPDLSTMKEKLWSTSVSDLETIQTIKDTWSDQGIILDPHGAVGLAALQKFRAKNKDNISRAIVLETAHPGKFCETVSEVIETDIFPPKSIKKIMRREPVVYKLDSSYENFKSFLLDKI